MEILERTKPEAPEASREVRVVQRAAALAADRQNENKPANPDEDWFSAEWIEDHWEVYNRLVKTARAVIPDAMPLIDSSELGGWPREEWCHELLVELARSA